MMQTDVLAATRTSTGTLIDKPARIKSMYFVSSSSAGTIVLKDGVSDGTTRMSIDTKAGVDGNTIYIPDNGVRFTTDVHVTLTNVTSVTVLYG